MSIVKSVRRDPRLAEIMIGAPAGQPEFAEWATLLGDDGAAIPFLRYLPERLSPLGARVETALRGRLAEAPSFVAFEGYDTIAVLADAASFARRGPGRHGRILAARCRRRHPRADPVLPRARHQRLAMGLAADPGRRSGSGRTRSLPDPAHRLRPAVLAVARAPPTHPSARRRRRPHGLGQIRVGKPVRARPVLKPPRGTSGGGK